MSFGEILVKNNIISQNLLVQSKKKAEKGGVPLEEELLKSGVSEKEILVAKSRAFNIPIKEIASSTRIPSELLRSIPEESARHYKFVPLQFKDGVVEIGIVYPDDIGAREALQFLSSKLNQPFRIFLISLSDLKAVLRGYQSLGGEAVRVLGEIESVTNEELASKKEDKKKKTINKIIEDAPVTKMVTVILRHAIEGLASDIHIEPLRDELKVRFRVDGVLYTSLMLPIAVHEAIVARIKVMTNMKLDEKRKPQDGRFEISTDTSAGKSRVDFRVSTFPSFFGEKVVIRILDTETGLKRIENVGMTKVNVEKVKKALRRTYGLILLTGPTGSGKTTTLYSMLSMIDREKLNVVSLEDPIEYNVEGVNQSQVYPAINYTFASGLRSILRQDPDVIMVGEIRDKETAQLAIQASLTGHLVLSTLHTNNAIGVIPRLIDMGVDPYLIPSTLVLVIAQRLVRTLFPESRGELKVEGTVQETIERNLKDLPSAMRKGIKIPEKIYQAKPSAICPRGTRGRVGVFEILRMTLELEKIILAGPTEFAIEAESRNQGMMNMKEDGVLKVLEGKVGLEELNEVV
ncbi:GspE/PulE family protein [Patescibacteria group bacterium]|nr:GspE/PulE family protein [Patescibacteria group bacterium]